MVSKASQNHLKTLNEKKKKYESFSLLLIYHIDKLFNTLADVEIR